MTTLGRHRCRLVVRFEFDLLSGSMIAPCHGSGIDVLKDNEAKVVPVHENRIFAARLTYFHRFSHELSRFEDIATGLRDIFDDSPCVSIPGYRAFLLVP